MNDSKEFWAETWKCLAFMIALMFASLAFSYVAVSVACGAEERVVNPPNDQAKWFISVVGEKDSAGYASVLNWFSVNDNLARLKDQVHFCQVLKGSSMYQARYARSQGEYAIRSFPCIRLQKPNGTVAYQVCGNAIPRSPDVLYRELGVAIQKHRDFAYGACPFGKCRPRPEPEPEPEPEPIPDPEPGPIDDGGPPIVEPQPEDTGVALVVGLVVVGLLAGAGVGVVRKLKDEYAK